jgi:N-acetylglutamate synthase-like GNAT family acetyltransferase
MSVRIRDATEGEIDRLTRLQPRWQKPSDSQFIIAEASSPTRLVGGLMMGTSRLKEGQAIGLLDVAIFPRFRETDVIGQLVETALSRFKLLGILDLELMSPQEEGTSEFGAWQRLGFAEDRRLIRYEYAVRALSTRTRTIYDRLVRQRGIPPGAQAVPLALRLWRDVVRLLLADNLIESQTLKEIEHLGPLSYFNPASRVLLLDGEVKGAVLTRVRGRYSEVMELTVTPELRGGSAWANALLLLHSTEIGAALGQEVVVMWADPARHPMTTRLARRMGSKPLETKIFLRKKFAPL